MSAAAKADRYYGSVAKQPAIPGRDRKNLARAPQWDDTGDVPGPAGAVQKRWLP
jgi:hypothetical protein